MSPPEQNKRSISPTFSAAAATVKFSPACCTYTMEHTSLTTEASNVLNDLTVCVALTYFRYLTKNRIELHRTTNALVPFSAKDQIGVHLNHKTQSCLDIDVLKSYGFNQSSTTVTLQPPAPPSPTINCHKGRTSQKTANRD